MTSGEITDKNIRLFVIFDMRIYRYLKELYQKRITIILSPRFVNRSFTFTINKLTIMILIVSFTAFLGANVYFGFSYSDRISLNSKLQYLKMTEIARTQNINHLSEKVDTLNQELEKRLEFSENIRLLYDEESILNRIENIAVGGKLEGADAELMKDIRLSKLSQLYQKVKIGYSAEETLKKKVELQNRIWKYTPTLKPTGGPIVSGFGYRRNPLGGGIQFHRGIDIVMPYGAPVVASADGVVETAGMKSGYGLVVVIKHRFGFKTRYAHLSKLLVKEGDAVTRGQVVGLIGATGWATGSHLHYEVIVNGIHEDPMKYILPDYIED